MKRYRLFLNGILVHESNLLSEVEWISGFIPGSKIWDDFEGVYMRQLQNICYD